jgi:hypothetical protein
MNSTEIEIKYQDQTFKYVKGTRCSSYRSVNELMRVLDLINNDLDKRSSFRENMINDLTEIHIDYEAGMHILFMTCLGHVIMPPSLLDMLHAETVAKLLSDPFPEILA